jgi:hypothetical protein
MDVVTESPDGDAVGSVAMSVIHALPGRLRLHLSDWSGEKPENLQEIIGSVRGVRDVRADSQTRNVLIHYYPAVTDQPAVLDGVQNSMFLAGWPTRMESGTINSDHDAYRALTRVAGDQAPDPSRIVLPVLHLVYSASPVGVAMHLGEITWALNRKLHAGRVALPVLHLIFSFSTIGIVLHLGELIWALAPFGVPDRRVQDGVRTRSTARRQGRP